MSENVFQRVEEKYLLTKKQYQDLFNTINENIEKDEYYEETICNIYFDTDGNDLIIDSMEKPPYKQKVRLRSYGTPKMEDDVFLEIKFKYNDTVGKRRTKLTLKEFNDYINNKTCNQNDQIMKELDYLFSYYKLKPAYFIGYDRKSYVGKENKNLRITVDTKLRSRKTDLSLEKGDTGKLYFDKDIYLMEIKTLGAMPLWLIKKLSAFEIYPASFSKYANIYKKYKEEVC